jgi:hypothetical protein
VPGTPQVGCGAAGVELADSIGVGVGVGVEVGVGVGVGSRLEELDTISELDELDTAAELETEEDTIELDAEELGVGLTDDDDEDGETDATDDDDELEAEVDALLVVKDEADDELSLVDESERLLDEAAPLQSPNPFWHVFSAQ